MNSSRENCPIDQLEWYANRTLSAAEQTAVEAHLEECAACRSEVEVWIELRQAMRGVIAQTPRPRADLLAEIERQTQSMTASVSWLRALRRLLTVCGDHLRLQVRLIRCELFWTPLLLIPLTAWMVILSRSGQEITDSAAMLAVLVAALGKAFLYGQEVDPPREMVLSTPTSPRLVLALRCGVMFGYDLLFNGGIVLPLLAWQGIVTPGWFLNHWLAPLLGLGAVAVFWGTLVNSGLAVFVCLGLWGMRLRILYDLPWQRHYASLWTSAPSMAVLALLALLLTLILLERKERFAWTG